ncbi:uncharacterized protein [Heptranchias perlo]|uniref:uncharacterized protein isoform X2 n=1 Tax=Heptranchias perlo TaxID=212740 RepID=UPI00355ACCFB
MSLKNHRILESFLNQNVDIHENEDHGNKLARSSKLGLLHQIEESERNMYVGNHLDPRMASSKLAKMPHLSRMRQRPSFGRDNRFNSQLSRANHLQLNINERKSNSHGPLNIFGSDVIPLHQLSHGPHDHYDHRSPLGISSPKFDNKGRNLKPMKHKVIKRVKRKLQPDKITNIHQETKDTTVFTFQETTTEKPEVIYTFESNYPDVVELDISSGKTKIPEELHNETIITESIVEVPQEDVSVYEIPDTPSVIEDIVEVGNNKSENKFARSLNVDSLKAEQKPLLRKALDPGHFSRTIGEAEIINLGDNEAIKLNVSGGSWHKPIGQFLDNAVQKNVETSYSENLAGQPNPKLTQLQIVKLLEDAYKKSPKEGNYSQQKIEDMVSELRTTKFPEIEIKEDEKEEEGKGTEVFPPPISRPRQRPRPHKGHELGKYVPSYAEIHTEQPKKEVSLSAVEYGHKLLLAIAVTVVVMIIIAVVCLIEICSQRSESKTPFATGDASCKKQSKSPLKKVTDRITKKSSAKDSQQAPLLDDDAELPKPLWLQDLYQPLDSVRKKSMGHGSHYKDSSDEEEVFSRANLSEPSDARTP